MTLSRSWHDEVQEIAEKFMKILCAFEFFIIFILIQETRKQNLLEAIKIAVWQFVDLC